MIRFIRKYLKQPDTIEFPRSHPPSSPFNKNHRTLLGFLRNFHWLIIIFPAAIWVVWPFISKFEEIWIQLMLWGVGSSSCIISLNAFLIIYRYNRWMSNYIDSIELLIQDLVVRNPEKAVEIKTFIIYGESRNFLLKYPNEYATIRMPALWSSMFGTKLMLWYSLAIAVITIVIIMKTNCGTQQYWSSISECFK